MHGGGGMRAPLLENVFLRAYMYIWYNWSADLTGDYQVYQIVINLLNLEGNFLARSYYIVYIYIYTPYIIYSSLSVHSST